MVTWKSSLARVDKSSLSSKRGRHERLCDRPRSSPSSNVNFNCTSFQILHTLAAIDQSLSSAMALAPKFAGQKFTAATSPATLHTLELYLDYVCPYSLKMFNTVYTSVFPLVRQKYASKVQILFRQQIQPWHPSSTLVHEAGVAVLKLEPSKFWDFSKVYEPSFSFGFI